MGKNLNAAYSGKRKPNSQIRVLSLGLPLKASITEKIPDTFRGRIWGVTIWKCSTCIFLLSRHTCVVTSSL